MTFSSQPRAVVTSQQLFMLVLFVYTCMCSNKNEPIIGHKLIIIQQESRAFNRKFPFA